MIEHPEFPPEEDDEAPADALPASPGMRRLAIALYIVIVVCVILGLLLSMISAGIFGDRFDFPLPESLSI